MSHLTLLSSIYRKIDRGDSVEDNEYVVVGQPGEAVVHSGGEEHGQDLEVEKERRPGSGLVLGDRRDDGNVVLGVGRVQQGVEAAGPRSHLACK